MNDVVTSPTPSIFAEGAPTGTAQNGTRYFDTTASPYAEYVYFAGAWQGPLGSGGMGGSNVYPYPPYGVVFGYGFSFVPPGNYGPYANLYAGYAAADAAYSTGGDINIRSGYPGVAPRQYSGNVSIFTPNAYGYYAYGGYIRIAAGSGFGTYYGNGGSVIISSGPGTGGTYGYGGDIILQPLTGSYKNGHLVLQYLPLVNPGGTGRVWNSGGTLKIT